MTAGAILSTDQSPSTHAEAQEMEEVPYQRGIGSLMYAATSTRPDIAFPVAILSQFMRNPGRTHWEAVKDVIRYLKGTADLKLTLGGTSAGLEAFVDADWASQPHRHSMSGYTVLLHGTPIAWSARKQSIIALSTAEAEYIALTAVAQEVLYLQALIEELYERIITPIPIYCDNQGAIALTSNSKFHARTKHIDLRFHFVRSLVKSGVFDIQYCPTEENIADIFTKALPRPRLQKLRAGLSLDTARGGVLDSASAHLSASDGRVQFGPVFCQILRTANRTMGSVLMRRRTMNWTIGSSRKQSGSGSARVRTMNRTIKYYMYCKKT
jgi:hypothetical protein